MFPYKWRLADGYPAQGAEAHGCTAFGTFVCGGGSTMGYKLAGYRHLGGVEIDPRMAKVYRQNHTPAHLFVEDIRAFNARNDLPAALYALDLLDGSPPCTTFSLAGDREKTWNRKKKFKEGQAEQVLDDLVFVYCDTIAKLRPKVAVLENVKGIVSGNAKWYAKQIMQRIVQSGYDVQVFLLNAASMGVPQRRERVFFIARRRDLGLPALRLECNQAPVPFGEIMDRADTQKNLTDYQYRLWKLRTPRDHSFGDIIERTEGRLSMYNNAIIHSGEVAPTLTSSAGVTALYDIPRRINTAEAVQVGSFPADYDFGEVPPLYTLGMSVPPVMMAHIAWQIYTQWLKKAA